MKKLSKVFIVFCSVLVFAFSFFSFFNIDNNITYADSVSVTYDFEGSNFSSPAVVYQHNPYSAIGSIACSFKFKFSVDSVNSRITANQACYLLNGYSSSWSGFYLNGMGVEYINIPMDNQFHYAFLHFGDIDNDTFVLMNCLMLVTSSNFTSNIKSVSFGSYFFNPLENVPLNDFSFYYNYVQYTDINGYSFYILIPYSSIDNQSQDFNNVYYPFAFRYRTYYLNNPDNFTDNENYNFGYEAGYNSGFNNGNSSGYNQGYDEGYNAGEITGFNDGYSLGIEDSNQYTFLSLIGSCIDAPIQYFQSLFNFDLLGVNLSSFLMGLFTLCVVVTIVKLCLGR